MPPSQLHQGYLVKQGQNWPHKNQERYFVLYDDQTLQYFGDDSITDEKNMKGKIKVTSARSRDWRGMPPKAQENGFIIVGEQESTGLFATQRERRAGTVRVEEQPAEHGEERAEVRGAADGVHLLLRQRELALERWGEDGERVQRPAAQHHALAQHKREPLRRVQTMIATHGARGVLHHRPRERAARRGGE